MLNIQNYVVKHTKGALSDTPWAAAHFFFIFLFSIFYFGGSHVRPLCCASWVGSSTKGSKDWIIVHVWSAGFSRRPGLWRRKGSTWSYGPCQRPKMENDNKWLWKGLVLSYDRKSKKTWVEKGWHFPKSSNTCVSAQHIWNLLFPIFLKSCFYSP